MPKYFSIVCGDATVARYGPKGVCRYIISHLPVKHTPDELSEIIWEVARKHFSHTANPYKPFTWPGALH